MHILSQVSLFDELNNEQLSHLHRLAFPLESPVGQIIFEEGSLGHQLYVILEGKVQIAIEDPVNPGQEVVLASLLDNEIFGEFSIFDDHPRSASAKTLEHSMLLEFHKADLWDLFETEPNIGLIIMKNLGQVLCERLRNMGSMLNSNL